MTETKRQSESDILFGVALACGAINAMAGNMAHCVTLFRSVDKLPQTLEESFHAELLETLTALDTIMQNMGNFLSNCDGVQQLEEVGTNSAYSVVRHLLRGVPLEDSDDSETEPA